MPQTAILSDGNSPQGSLFTQEEDSSTAAGRPKKAEDEKLVNVGFGLIPLEKEAAKLRADALGLTLSEYLRVLVLIDLDWPLPDGEKYSFKENSQLPQKP